MKNVLTVIIAIMSVGMMGLFSGCADNQAEKNAIEKVLVDNLRALQNEDLDGYLATLDEESPGYEKMKLLCPKIFEIYDLDHELENIDILKISGQDAKVRTIQTARRLAGPENYRDNRSIMVHTLKKRGDAWKLSETTHESTDYID